MLPPDAPKYSVQFYFDFSSFRMAWFDSRNRACLTAKEGIVLLAGFSGKAGFNQLSLRRKHYGSESKKLIWL